MNLSVLWSEKFNEKEPDSEAKTYNSVYDLCISPDNERLVVGAGTKVLLYRYLSGDLIKMLKAHKDNVNSVHFSLDSEMFVSASKDHMVIVWTKYGKGIFKFSHSASIQRCRFSYVNETLISCCSEELCFCYPEKRKVERLKLDCRVRSLEWTRDGSIFAIGNEKCEIQLLDGETGESYRVISVSATVWGIAFIYDEVNQAVDNTSIGIAACDMTEVINFYDLDGYQRSSRVQAGFQVACLVTLQFEHLYLLGASGHNGSLLLLTKDGVRVSKFDLDIGLVTSLSLSGSEASIYASLGSFRGEVANAKMYFSFLNAASVDRVALVNGMTTVVIHSLAAEDEKSMIKTGAAIFGISIFGPYLVVLHEKDIVQYEVYSYDSYPYSITYTLKNKFPHGHSSLYSKQSGKPKYIDILAFSENIVSIYGNLCIVYDTEIGSELPSKRKISFACDIVAVSSLPGHRGKEDFAVLTSGSILYFVNVFHCLQRICLKLDTTFYVGQVTLRMSPDHQFAAIIADAQLELYNLTTRKCVLSREKMVDLVFNSRVFGVFILLNSNYELELCTVLPKILVYGIGSCSFGNLLVLFDRNLLFYIRDRTVKLSVKVSFSKFIFSLINDNKLSEAYTLAKYTDSAFDWRLVGEGAAYQLNLDISVSAFRNIGQYKYVWALERLKYKYIDGSVGNDGLQVMQMFADVCLIFRNYDLAAQMFGRIRINAEGINKFLKLDLFSLTKRILEERKENEPNKYKLFIEKVHTEEGLALIREGKYTAAIPLFVSIGNLEKAIVIATQYDLQTELLYMARKLKSIEEDKIKRIGSVLAQKGFFTGAEECYTRVNDTKALIELCLQQDKFTKAFHISAQADHKYDPLINYHKGVYLSNKKDYSNALKCFKLAGNEDKTKKYILDIIKSFYRQKKFSMAGYFSYVLTLQDEVSEDMEQFIILSRALYIQSQINTIVSTPFSITQKYSNPFNMLCYLVYANSRLIENTLSITISIIDALQYLIAASGPEIPVGAAFWARSICRSLYLPKDILDKLDHAVIKSLITNRLSDDNGNSLSVMCYRCSFTLSNLRLSQIKYEELAKLTHCPNCYHIPIFSFCSFDVLPLVEFRLPPGMDDENAKRAMAKNNDVEDVSEEFSFEVFLCSYDFKSTGLTEYVPLVISENVLMHIPVDEYFTVEYGTHTYYYKNVLPDVSITQCACCQTFFFAEEIEEESLYYSNNCPVCQNKLY